MNQEQARSASGQSDYDQNYAWGRPPATYLAQRQVVRLMIMRSRLDDRHLLRNRAPGSESAEPAL
jgi:hypothetical protein